MDSLLHSTKMAEMSDIANALGITPIEDTEYEVINLPTEIVTSKDQAATDIEYARRNIKDLIDMGQASLTDLVALAKQSQHPRAFEVIGSLLKTLSETNAQLIDVHRQKAAVLNTNGSSGPDRPTNVTQNLFVGSTAELQKMLENARNPKTD